MLLQVWLMLVASLGRATRTALFSPAFIHLHDAPSATETPLCRINSLGSSTTSPPLNHTTQTKRRRSRHRVTTARLIPS